MVAVRIAAVEQVALSEEHIAAAEIVAVIAYWVVTATVV